jgi:hypothetical protein
LTLVAVAVSRASTPGQKPPFLAVNHPARPYKPTNQNRCTVGNATGA